MKRQKIIFLIIISIQLVNFIEVAASINFNVQQNISNASGNFPLVTSDSSGLFVYSAWSDASTNDIKVFRSIDFGTSWIDTGVSFGQGSFIADIATDSAGRYVYILWLETSNVKVFSSNDFGITWTDISSGLGTSAGATPHLAINNTGQYVYVIKSGITIFYSNDFGATFTDSGGVFGSGDVPTIITNSSGKYVYAAWRKTGIPPNNLRVFYSDDFGVNWTESSGSFGETASGATPQLATGNSGQYVYVTWPVKTTNVVKVFSSNDFGVNFSDTGGSFGDTAFQPFIDTNNTGQYVYMIRDSSSGTDVSIFSSRNFGTAWSEFQVTGSINVTDPTIKTDTSGMIAYGVWRNNNAAEALSIYYTTDSGITWISAGTVGGGSNPNIAIAGTLGNSSGNFVYIVVDNNNRGRITILKGIKSFFPINVQNILRI